MKRTFWFPIAIAFVVMQASFASGATYNINLNYGGLATGTTAWYYSDLTTLPISQIASVTIQDSNSGVGGSPGIFSGFDVDALYLGSSTVASLSATSYYASSFDFTAGTVRPTPFSNLQPNASHPGALFGSTSTGGVDLATATLNSYDGVAVADVNVAAGFISLGDGGILTANFSPPIGSDPPGMDRLYLFTGEVGNNGEALVARVTVSDTATVPEPSALLLFGSGLLGLVVYGRKRMKK